MFSQFKPLGFIGCGSFAELIIAKLLQTKTVEVNEIIVGVRRKERAKELTSRHGIIAFANDNTAVCTKSNSLILAVRPGQVLSAVESLAAKVCSGKLLISIAAAVRISLLMDLFGTSKVCRVNPNPQIATGKGLTAVSNSHEVTPKEIEWISHLFGCMSEVVHLNEEHLDCISVLSGVTHTLYFVECLLDAALYLGLPLEIATKLVIQSMEGAAELFGNSPERLGELIRNAATPGGIGVEKLFTLDRFGVKGAIIEAMKSGLKKAQQFGNLKGEVA
jgi:pyrroline-5-carboxylate reductase